MNNYHFISYSTVDGKAYAQQLYDALWADSISVWMDKPELRAGRDWDTQVSQALESCKTLLLLVTPDSVKDNCACKQEYSLALDLKKPIVPLLFERGARLPFRLQSRQYIDFTGDFKPALAKLRLHLQWLDSPDGELHALQDRLADARRDLDRAKPTDRAPIKRDIALPTKQVAEQKRKIRKQPGAAGQPIVLPPDYPKPRPKKRVFQIAISIAVSIGVAVGCFALTLGLIPWNLFPLTPTLISQASRTSPTANPPTITVLAGTATNTPVLTASQTFAPSRIPTATPTAAPTQTLTPTPTPRVIYDWPYKDGWQCWDMRYDPVTTRPYGLALSENALGLEFHVDFSKSPENVGQVHYLSKENSQECARLSIPANAAIQADVRMLDDVPGVETEIFMQTPGFKEWFAGRPTMPLQGTAFWTIRPDDRSWVTGKPPVPISREGKTEFVNLGIEFKRTPPSGLVRFVITRVWVTMP